MAFFRAQAYSHVLFADRLDTKYYAPFVPVYNFQIRRLANDAKVSVQLGQTS